MEILAQSFHFSIINSKSPQNHEKPDLNFLIKNTEIIKKSDLSQNVQKCQDHSHYFERIIRT